MKLLSIQNAQDGIHKLVATFDTGKKTKFGAAGYTDYLKSKDPVRRDRYLERHGRGREDWSNPTSAGALSRYLLWGDATVLATNIRAYKHKFNL